MCTRRCWWLVGTDTRLLKPTRTSALCVTATLDIYIWLLPQFSIRLHGGTCDPRFRFEIHSIIKINRTRELQDAIGRGKRKANKHERDKRRRLFWFNFLKRVSVFVSSLIEEHQLWLSVIVPEFLILHKAYKYKWNVYYDELPNIFHSNSNKFVDTSIKSRRRICWHSLCSATACFWCVERWTN